MIANKCYLNSNRKQINTNTCYVSTNLIKLLDDNYSLVKSKLDFTYHYYYFCSTIYYINSIEKNNIGDYCHVKYAIMKNIISQRKLTEIIANLIKWGVIECNHSYQVNNYSNGYRLVGDYAKDIIDVNIYDVKLNKKLNDYKKTEMKNIKTLPFAYQQLAYNNRMINIDASSAFKTINMSNSDYTANKIAINDYLMGNYRFSVDKFGNRAHTNLTNISKSLRKFLHVDGKKLVSIDIKNSQPLFFGLYLKQNKISTIDTKEIDKYLNLVGKGEFYELFMGDEDDRSMVKQRVLTQVFFDNHRADSKYNKLFAVEFPTIMQYIIDMKKVNKTTIAKMLQQTEAKFMIENVVIRWNQITNYGFCSTIHDSFVVTEDKVQDAYDMIVEEFNKLNIVANLSVEEF